MLAAMTPHESPGDPEHDDLPQAGREGDQPQAGEPEPAPRPKRARTGSIAPPGAEERAAQAAAELPAPGGGGLLDRIRRKLGR
jgi:hypothetical protein